jgi:hypothetical protein
MWQKSGRKGEIALGASVFEQISRKAGNGKKNKEKCGIDRF